MEKLAPRPADAQPVLTPSFLGDTHPTRLQAGDMLATMPGNSSIEHAANVLGNASKLDWSQPRSPDAQSFSALRRLSHPHELINTLYQNTLRRLATMLLTACALLHAPTTALAISNGVAPKPEDTRYDAVAALSFAHWLGLDPVTGEVSSTCGGAANCQENNWFCNATLLSSTTIVTAKHCVASPPPPYAVRFRRHASGTLGTLDGGPSSYHHVRVMEWHTVPGNIDMMFGTLAKAVTHIQPIGPLTLGVGTLAVGTPVEHAGWGKQGPLFNEGPLTELRLCATSLASTPTISFGTVSPGANPPNCSVNMHDSGSPILIQGPGGALRTLGVTTSVGAGMTFIGLPGPPTLPLVHTPFDGYDLALRVEMADQLLGPKDTVMFGVAAEDVGALPILTPIAVDVTLENSDGLTVALGTVTVTPSPNEVAPQFEFALPFLPAKNFASYRLRANGNPNQTPAEALTHNNVVYSTTFASVTSNPADAVSLWSTGLPGAGHFAAVTRASGAIDLAVTMQLLDLAEVRLDVVIDPEKPAEFKSPLGTLVVAKTATEVGFNVTLTSPTLTKTKAAQAVPRLGVTGHLAGIYAGESSDAVPLVGLVGGNGTFALQLRAMGIPAVLHAYPAEKGTFAFDTDASIVDATWDVAGNTFKLTLTGGAEAPAGTLWLIAPKSDLDHDGAPADADCAPNEPAIFPGAVELCNGIDDDCDGTIDAAPLPTKCGVGACAATGERSCTAGTETDSCVPAAPAASDATCDGIDDDCDGTIDEDGACGLPSDDARSLGESSCAIARAADGQRSGSLLPIAAALLVMCRRRHRRACSREDAAADSVHTR